MFVDFDVRELQQMDFFTGGSVGLWTHILAGSNGLQLQLSWWICLLMMNLLYKHRFSLHKMLTDGLEWCGLLVDYCDVFISCLDSHSDGTHSLQRIHWWASHVVLHFSKSVPMKKETHLYLGWPKGEYIFSKFWVNNPFNCSVKNQSKSW